MATSTIVDRQTVVLNKVQTNIVKQLYGPDVIENTVVEKITYVSDGLKVKGYIARPSADHTYPVLIWNRGGSGKRGALDDLRAHLILASTAVWGYVVLATQYRGNAGGEGREDWGGEDVNDALNLIDVASNLPQADISRIGIEGASRGGITVFRALTLGRRFRCAIVHAGVTDLIELESNRSDFGNFTDIMFGHLSLEERQRELSRRSAVYLVDRFPRDCPILILHGDADKRVPIAQSIALVEELKKFNVPYVFTVISGGGHVALKDGSYREIDIHRKAWLEKYLRGTE